MTKTPTAQASAREARHMRQEPSTPPVEPARRRASPGAPKLKFRDPEGTKDEIIAAATAEFCAKGYDGARVSKIVDRTRTSKRMIYYYFGSKKKLYEASLIKHYSNLKIFGETIKFDNSTPRDTLSILVRIIFDWNIDNAALAPLVMNENIMGGKYIKRIDERHIDQSNFINLLQSILDEGSRINEIRPGLRAVEIYASIASLSFFNTSNTHTFSALFGHDMMQDKNIKKRREDIVFMIDQFVKIHP